MRRLGHVRLQSRLKRYSETTLDSMKDSAYERALHSRQSLQIICASLHPIPRTLCEIMTDTIYSVSSPEGHGIRTYSALRTDPVSLAVPSWSTSFNIPCTLAFILNTCIDMEDCSVKNALSSGDCGDDDDAPRGMGASPVSMS